MNDKGEYIQYEQISIFDILKNQNKTIEDNLGCPPSCPIGVTCSSCPYNN